MESFRQDDGPSDGSSYFLEAFNTKTNKTIIVLSHDKALSLVHWPVRVGFFIGAIFRVSSFMDVTGKKSVISDSLTDKDNTLVSSRDLLGLLIYWSLIRWPSLVSRIHSLSLALPPGVLKPGPLPTAPKPRATES